MNISCEIIKDLLPLYHDRVCSEESKALVEQHLASCDHCRIELQSMDGTLAIHHTEQNLKEAEALQNLSRRWKQGMLWSLLKGASIAVVTMIVLLFFLYLFLGFKIVPKS